MCPVAHSRSQIIPGDVSARGIFYNVTVPGKYDYFDALEIAK